MEKQEVTALAATDLSAACDKLDHDILLEVLCGRIGIEGVLLISLESYLQLQNFKVNVTSECSPPRNIYEVFCLPKVMLRTKSLLNL